MSKTITKVGSPFELSYPETTEFDPDDPGQPTLPITIAPAKSVTVGHAKGTPDERWLRLTVDKDVVATSTVAKLNQDSWVYLTELKGSEGNWTVWGRLESSSQEKQHVWITILNYWNETQDTVSHPATLAPGDSLQYDLPLLDQLPDAPEIQQLSIVAVSKRSSTESPSGKTNYTNHLELQPKLLFASADEPPPTPPSPPETPTASLTVKPALPSSGSTYTLHWQVSNVSSSTSVESVTLYGGTQPNTTTLGNNSEGDWEGSYPNAAGGSPLIAGGTQIYQLVANLTLPHGVPLTLQATCPVISGNQYGSIELPAETSSGNRINVTWTAFAGKEAWLVNAFNSQRVSSAGTPANGTWSYTADDPSEVALQVLTYDPATYGTIHAEGAASPVVKQWTYVRDHQEAPLGLPANLSSAIGLIYYESSDPDSLTGGSGYLLIVGQDSLYKAVVGVDDNGSPWRDAQWEESGLMLPTGNAKDARWWGAAGLTEGFVALRSQEVGTSTTFQLVHSDPTIDTLTIPGFPPPDKIRHLDLVAVDDLLLARVFTSTSTATPPESDTGHGATGHLFACWTVDYTQNVPVAKATPEMRITGGGLLTAIGHELFVYFPANGGLIRHEASVAQSSPRTFTSPVPISAPTPATNFIPMAMGNFLRLISPNQGGDYIYGPLDASDDLMSSPSIDGPPAAWHKIPSTYKAPSTAPLLTANRCGDSPRTWALEGEVVAPNPSLPTTATLFTYSVGNGSEFLQGEAVASPSQTAVVLQPAIHTIVNYSGIELEVSDPTTLDEATLNFLESNGIHVGSTGPIGPSLSLPTPIMVTFGNAVSVNWLKGSQVAYTALWKLAYPTEATSYYAALTLTGQTEKLDAEVKIVHTRPQPDLNQSLRKFQVQSLLNGFRTVILRYFFTQGLIESEYLIPDLAGPTSSYSGYASTSFRRKNFVQVLNSDQNIKTSFDMNFDGSKPDGLEFVEDVARQTKFAAIVVTDWSVAAFELQPTGSVFGPEPGPQIYYFTAKYPTFTFSKYSGTFESSLPAPIDDNYTPLDSVVSSGWTSHKIEKLAPATTLSEVRSQLTMSGFMASTDSFATAQASSSDSSLTLALFDGDEATSTVSKQSFKNWLGVVQTPPKSPPQESEPNIGMEILEGTGDPLV